MPIQPSHPSENPSAPAPPRWKRRRRHPRARRLHRAWSRSRPSPASRAVGCSGRGRHPPPLTDSPATGQRKAKCAGIGIGPCPPCVRRGIAASCVYPQSRRVIRPPSADALETGDVNDSALLSVEAKSFRCDMCNVSRCGALFADPSGRRLFRPGARWTLTPGLPRSRRKRSGASTNSVGVSFSSFLTFQAPS